MLRNIESRDKLRGLAHSKAKHYETKTVHPKLVEEETAKGWIEDKWHKKTVRLRREKGHADLLEDRVWTLLYRMGFTQLSGRGGASILLDHKDADGPKSQIDVVGIDDDVAIAIECKSAENYGRRPQFQEELGKHALIRGSFARAIGKQFTVDHKRAVVVAMFLSNIQLSENDRNRAAQANVALFDDRDLEYYERLISQLGPAGKYQFLSDTLPNKEIPGLRIRVPAIRAKMGAFNCYSFCISPEYLLKICFVSHRLKGKASDIDTYQRMLQKSRLNQIKDYITNDGIFPTNIVINIDRRHLRFERIQQDDGLHFDSRSGKLGWLEIRPTYKSAWVIDGQHRLFAYSGHRDAARSLLSVLAFEGLPPSKQAELFIDINNKQKSVRRSLLEELFAELHWDAADPLLRVQAIVSKAIQDLDVDPESPFYQRIQKADKKRTPTRCITLASVYGAISKKGFHIAKERHGCVLEYGPLWAGDQAKTLKRTTLVFKSWFNLIRTRADDWWVNGSGEGGGLAMNDSIITCINVLLSVFDHLEASGQKLIHLDDEDLCESLRPYGQTLGSCLGALSQDERRQFRSLRGIQGQTTRTRRCQLAIRSQIPDFNPPGLDEFVRLERAETNLRAKEILDRVEVMLQAIVVGQLHQGIGMHESKWWVMGVPKAVRLRVTERYEEDDGRRGSKEYYFDLLDYKKIAAANWPMFEPLLAYGKKSSSKDARTAWLDFLNEQRKIVAHPSSGASVSLESLDRLQELKEWLSSVSKKHLPE